MGNLIGIEWQWGEEGKIGRKRLEWDVVGREVLT